MNICHRRNAKMCPHLGQNLQRLFIADTGKRVHTRTICLAVTAFENQGQLQALTHAHQMLRDFKCHVAAFNGARSGHHKKTVGIGKM